MIVTILVKVNVIIIGIGVGTDLGSLNGSFDGYNYGNLGDSLLGDLLGSYDVFEVVSTNGQREIFGLDFNSGIIDG